MVRIQSQAFFLEKSKMELKFTRAATVDIERDGKICIQQWCDSTNSVVEIYLTLEQFNSIESWVFKNRDEIESRWNNGAEDE
jgi:hypothetical protein